MSNEFNASPEQLQEIGLLALRAQKLNLERLKEMRKPSVEEFTDRYLDLSEETAKAQQCVRLAMFQILGVPQ